MVVAGVAVRIQVAAVSQPLCGLADSVEWMEMEAHMGKYKLDYRQVMALNRWARSERLPPWRTHTAMALGTLVMYSYPSSKALVSDLPMAAHLEWERSGTTLEMRRTSLAKRGQQ